jgi:hypothetical protein
VERAGGSAALQDLYASWASEIGPDFWTFCGSGIAAVAGIRDILSLPPDHVLRITFGDPHPPPFVRVRLAFECARQVWGQGEYDRWEREFVALYPLEGTTRETAAVLHEAVTSVPAVARALLNTRFRVLGNRPIAALFDLPALAPDRLKPIVERVSRGRLQFGGLSPAGQLAVFRGLLEWTPIRHDALDAIATEWLVRSGSARRPAPSQARAS